MRWAGAVADEVKLGGSANPEFVAVARMWLANDVTKIVAGSVSVVDEDGDWAREKARAAVEPYLGVVGQLDPTLQLEQGELPPLECFCIAGTPEDVAQRVVELWEAGAHRVELGTPQGRTPLAGVELICERVLPLLGR